MAKILQVDAEGLNVREKPKDGDVIAQLSYGHSVEEIKKRGSWSEIKTTLEGQALEGFVANRYLRDPNKGPGMFRWPFGKPNVSLQNLQKFATRASDDVLQAFDDQLDDILSEFDINKNAKRLSHFLAQLSHESMGFTVVEENLNYSGDGLWRVFRRHFRSRDEAESFARQPEKIANRVYANRIGNGPEASGDGFRYRGRGFIQLTGKANYEEYGRLLGIDLVGNPEQAADTGNALRIAAAYWDQNGLNKLADRNDLNAITRRINGGLNGLQDRIHEFQKAAAVWAAPFVGSDGKPKKDRSGTAAGGAAVGGTGAATTSGVDIYESESTENEQDIDEVVEEVVEDVTGVDVSDEAPATEDAPADVVPEEPAPEEAPAEDVPVEEAPIEEPVAEAPTEEAPTEEPVVEAPSAEVPEEEPVEDVPVDEAPAEPDIIDAPEEPDAEDAPVEDALAESEDAVEAPESVTTEEPVTEAPVEEAPAVPVEDVAREDLPVDPEAQPAEEQPAEEQPTEEPAVEVVEPPVEDAAEPEIAEAPEEAPVVPEPEAPADVAEEPVIEDVAEAPEADQVPVEEPAPVEEALPPIFTPEAQESVTEAVEEVTTGAIEHAMDEENQLELTTFLFAALVIICALYLIWARIRR